GPNRHSLPSPFAPFAVRSPRRSLPSPFRSPRRFAPWLSNLHCSIALENVIMQCRFLQQLFVVSSVLSIFFGSAGSGRAQLIFDFTYSDTAGNTAQGTLTAVNSGLCDGSLWATSGMLTVLT